MERIYKWRWGKVLNYKNFERLSGIFEILNQKNLNFFLTILNFVIFFENSFSKFSCEFRQVIFLNFFKIPSIPEKVLVTKLIKMPSPDADNCTSTAWCPTATTCPTSQSCRRRSCTCSTCTASSSHRTSPKSLACLGPCVVATIVQFVAPKSPIALRDSTAETRKNFCSS